MLGEEFAHLAGFSSSVGNWIAPNGDLIVGRENTDHYMILVEYEGDPKTDNNLKWMNQKVEQDGFIRLVFRNEVWFHVNCRTQKEIWGETPNFKRMISILQRLGDTEVQIFSKTLNIIGSAKDVVEHNVSQLQIRERDANLL